MPPRLRHGPMLLALAVVAAGCASTGYRLVEPRRVSIDGVFTVEPQRAWTATMTGKIETWTVDGFVLEALRFFKGIENGEPLVPAAKGEEQPPRFQTSMSLTEVAEMVSDSLFAGRVRATDLHPISFGSAPGFRFESRYLTRSGVERRALVTGTVLRNRLYVIVYDAVALHYYPKYEPEVERLIESVRLQ